MIRDDSGLIVHRGSRTERLAEKLAVALEAERPANPLQSQTVIVAHPGLRRWLLGQFACRPGVGNSPGIAANFNMILPWQWLESEARRTLGDVALIDGAYRREFLRWHIFRALPASDSAQIATYLAGVDGDRRRFQLAEHLAGVYAQYLVYRPDWILGWERGPTHGENWQAALWRKVQASIGKPHRAQRHDALCRALATKITDHLPLHVFGVSHLPPDILDVLRASATQRSRSFASAPWKCCKSFCRRTGPRSSPDCRRLPRAQLDILPTTACASWKRLASTRKTIFACPIAP